MRIETSWWSRCVCGWIHKSRRRHTWNARRRGRNGCWANIEVAVVVVCGLSSIWCVLWDLRFCLFFAEADRVEVSWLLVLNLEYVWTITLRDALFEGVLCNRGCCCSGFCDGLVLVLVSTSTRTRQLCWV